MTLAESSVEELIRQYEDAARQWGGLTREGELGRRHQPHEVMARIYRELRRRSVEAMRALVPLLASDDTSVRLWSSSHLLFVLPDVAESVLEALEADDDFGFDAKTTLRQWRAGGLRFS